MEVNGIAHIFLTASNFERSREFYRKLLPFLGMKPVIDSDTSFYCVDGRTAVGINAPASEHAGGAFEQNRVGLHQRAAGCSLSSLRSPLTEPPSVIDVAYWHETDMQKWSLDVRSRG
jgi:catechol 2,3-dioxygenase-like lactoylglutathione lyase family enzyme